MMNQRIRELAGQAKCMAEETLNKQISKNAELDAFAEKFAELIVRECLDTIQRGIDNGGGANEDIVMAGKLALFYSYRNIQARFGMGDYKDQEHSGVES
jgi:hypothetical protein